MIVVLLMAAVAVASFWAGKNSRADPTAETAHDPAPVWPWVAGAAVLGVLLLGMTAGPVGPFGGPGLFGP